MADLGYNKVVFGGKTLIDLTGDSVSPEAVDKGIIFHDKSGAQREGTSTKDSDTSDATAAVAEILQDKTAYVRGAKLTGTMPNNGAVDLTIDSKDQEVTIPQGYHDGSGTAAISLEEQAKIIPGNIKQGITLLGVDGTYSGEGATSQSKTVTPSLQRQTIQPDEGYDFLASVTVEPIPYTETDNSAGGITVTIGA